MEPAASIILKFGGDTAVSRITGVHRTRVANWKRPKDAGGTGGVIPIKHIGKLLAAAPAMGVEVVAQEFLPMLGDRYDRP